MKKYLLTILFLFTSFLFHNSTSAQVNNVGHLLRGGVEDSNLLLKHYLEPYAKGFSAGLNSGWNNSARPYRTLGFDLRISGTLAFVPPSDETFDIAQLESQFQQLELLSSSGVTPTVAGDDVTGATIGRRYFNPRTQRVEELFSFEMPKGTGYPLVPAPMVQGTIGISGGTDLSLRIVPPVKSGRVDGRVTLFGIGATHGLNQWFPGGSVLPFDISLQAGYTHFNFEIDTNVQPESGSDIRNDYDPSEWEDQQVELTSKGFTANLLVGRNLPILSFFGGVGYQSSTTDITSIGSFPLTIPNVQPGPEPKAIEALVDPVDISISGENTIHGLAGLRIRLGLIALSGSFTISKYPVANLGIGISMR